MCKCGRSHAGNEQVNINALLKQRDALKTLVELVGSKVYVEALKEVEGKILAVTATRL